MGLAAIQPVAVGAVERTVLVLGRISDDPKSHYDQLKPLLDYVVPRMRDVGIVEGRVLMAKDAQQMASYLRRGRVDWVTETAGTAMALQQRADARPLLLTERSGVSAYQSVFFVRRDSPLMELEDLKGRTLAMQSALSTSAYLVPVMELLEHGVQPEILLTPSDAPAADAVGYVFARSELNISTYVHKRVVDAGVISSIDWNDDRSMPPAFRRDMRVLYRSEPIPRAIEMVRADLEPAVRERLQAVLLEASRDPFAGPALAKFFGTTGFYAVDPASQQALARLRNGLVRVRMEVE
ncbi:phosphate/phosphite/phosphonate ABC transporter substrate-binding protein [Stenotrophomonas sp. SY1]|uniref:phosphate/phosphite/phosphonate ABC transporter substrate-binding protein n=1 Tax=Stenotrophomonas sp. SY1 TaxID=477235 RepID=UPI001E64E52D|nr:phosphate/phosphite/phosphonate ABC transporter substrate-binding protein [Stenotrophomonas sp. SY1]MCD9087312.1 phosphate/phosphite/phosphonate ABC transporter substrate-binding protein [Stenotrophomonas sp. SY1]